MKRFKKPTVNVKQKINTTVASWNLAKLTKYFLIFAVVILLATFWVWYTRLYLTNERRFWNAIETSMSVPSVVRTLEQGGSGNQVIQQYRFHYAPQQVIENKVQFTQKSATVDTSVVTEGIIFPDDQYLRYVAFENNSPSGESVSDIDELLGQWARQEAPDPEEARLNYLSEYVTLVVFGNFPANIRSEIMQELQDGNVYSVDYENAIEDTVNGDEVLRYATTVNLRAFAETLNGAFIRAGYGDFPPLNPENYREGSTLNSSIVVKKRDNTIVGVNFGNRQETYSNYGVVKNIEVPDASLTIEELQSRVQQSIDL